MVSQSKRSVHSRKQEWGEFSARLAYQVISQKCPVITRACSRDKAVPQPLQQRQAIRAANYHPHQAPEICPDALGLERALLKKSHFAEVH